MSVGSLIEAFETRTQLPIDVNDVVEYLRRNHIKDKIEFICVDIDTKALRGQLVQWEIPGLNYGEPTLCADVYFGSDQGSDWIRFVCCKELLHLLDPFHAKVGAKEDFLKLAEKIALPPEMQDPIRDGEAVASDRIAVYQALAILLPKAARDILKAEVDAGRMTTTDVARIADIPQRFATLAMHELWDEVYPNLRAI